MRQSKEIYTLGKHLVTELGLDDGVDTLSRWMAHHIAELIKESESAAGSAKIKKDKECREAILDLWKTRHELPNGKRPFEGFEEILRALERLDPENKTPRYFPSPPPRSSGLDSRLIQQLKLIEGLDYAARVLIESALGEAVSLSKGPVRKWIKSVRDETAEGGDIEIIRRIILTSDALESEEPEDAELEALESRLKRLESFHALTAVAIGDLQKKLRKKSKKPSNTKSKRKAPSRAASKRI